MKQVITNVIKFFFLGEIIIICSDQYTYVYKDPAWFIISKQTKLFDLKIYTTIY